MRVGNHSPVPPSQPSESPKPSKQIPPEAQKLASILLERIRQMSPAEIRQLKEKILQYAGYTDKSATPLFGYKEHASQQGPVKALSLAELHTIPEASRLFLGIQAGNKFGISQQYQQACQAQSGQSPTQVALVVNGKNVTLSVTHTLNKDLDYQILTAIASVFAAAVGKKEEGNKVKGQEEAPQREGARGRKDAPEERVRTHAHQETQQPSKGKRTERSTPEDTRADESRQAEKKRSKRLAETTRQDHVRVDDKHAKEQTEQEDRNKQ